MAAFSRAGFAQPGFPEISDSARVGPDGAGVTETFRLGDSARMLPRDTLRAQRTTQSEHFFSSPTGALLRSVVFPGWGQWANGKKQKAAMYFAVESYWITKALIWRDRARSETDLSEFEHARDRRNYFYWLTGITVFISMFDAYADRYLLTLERTRDAPEGFWGDYPDRHYTDGWRVVFAVRF